MLATDWRSPSRMNLARISDQRARQFWDPTHLVAQELNRFAKDHAAQPEPECCFDKGFYWDDAILYVPQSRWKDAAPPLFLNGPVWKQIPGLEKALNDPR